LEAFDLIKREFCSLFTFKSHGDTLEVITPLASITDKFVSVFVVWQHDKIVVADGGRLNGNAYGYDETEHDKQDKEQIDLITEQYMEHFGVQIKVLEGRSPIYYKSVYDVALLPAAVYDLANFIVCTVNAHAIEYKSRQDRNERTRFRSETNEFLRGIYHKRFNSNEEIRPGLRYSGVIKQRNKLHLIEYVTGHTARYFDQDIRRAIVNFQLVDEMGIGQYVSNKIAIYNDKSAGYEGGSKVYTEFLGKFLTYALPSTRIEEIREIIPEQSN
jgi:hypothetical protein